jgi:hypothetical protein
MANFTPTQRMFRSIAARLEDYRVALCEEIDAHNARVDGERERFESSSAGLCKGAESDLRGIVNQLSEPRKATMFG